MSKYQKPPKPEEQVGGDHYSRLGVEPIQFIETNGLGYHEGNVIKYISRWRNKNGIEDLKKAKWYVDRLLALEEATQAEARLVLNEQIANDFFDAIEKCSRTTKAGKEVVTDTEQLLMDAARYFTECRPEGVCQAYVSNDCVKAHVNGEWLTFSEADC